MIYVINHKSPDLDSTVAAISYANLKNKLDNTNQYIAVSTGALNKETEYVLDKFGIRKPEILDNLAAKKVILIDHNEFSQAQQGVEQANIIGIIDHHKVDFKYSEPIHIEVRPWGSSCSIIANKYLKSDIKLEKNIASALLAGILVDTVITKSPTCTDIDKKIINKLAQIAKIKNWQEFGMEIFKVRSSISDFSATDIIKNDFKNFNFKAGKFGIGQIETVRLDDFANREEELLDGINQLREKNSYHSVILFITDIIKEGSKFLIATEYQDKIEQALNKKLKNNKVYINGIISRKKQVVPMVSKVFDK